MAEVLSQEEIDALLSALSSGDVEPETIDSVEEDIHKVKQYDFKTPQKFSKDHIRTLEKVHTKFARLISNYLTMQTRKSVKVNVENVEQVPYEEFIRSIPNPTIISYFKLHPMQGNIVMELNPEFGFQILDLLLGGFGVKRGIDKDLTEIEKVRYLYIEIGKISSFNVEYACSLDDGFCRYLYNEKMSIMLFTSGTTSDSKIVALSHKNLVSNLMDIASSLDINSSDVFLSFLPLHHVFECTVGFLFSLYVGAETVFCDGIRYIVDNLKEYKVSVMASVPAIYERIFKIIRREIAGSNNLEEILENEEKYKKSSMEEKKKVSLDEQFNDYESTPVPEHARRNWVDQGIVWMGAGMGAIIVMTLAISLIVTILNMYEGFRATDAQKTRLMAAMGASRWQLLRMLVFPANYATLLNTLKVNVGLSWVGVIMGEFLVSRAGLGYLIVYGSQVFNMDLVMTSVLLLLVAAVVMYRLVLWVEKILYHLLGVKA